MDNIKIERLEKNELDKLGVFSWPIWEKEVSTFDWEYSNREQCYILDGEVVVEPENGDPVSFGEGDFVTFPKGMKCVWKIAKAVKKHYNFG